MIIRRDPRALNARKHGLTEAIHDGSLATIVVAMAIRMVPDGAGQCRRRAAEQLLASYFEKRRTAEVKLRLLEHAAKSIGFGEAGLEVYAQAHCHPSANLEKIERYERRAESQFLSASRGYVRAESTTRGVGLDEA
jgi:hypothetical protein